MILHLATERMLAHVDEHGIGWMTFNNPARHNALSLEMWQAIGDILEHFQNDEAVRAVRTCDRLCTLLSVQSHVSPPAVECGLSPAAVRAMPPERLTF